MSESTDNLSDEQVVERVIRGEKQSYAIVVNRYKNLVYRLAINELRNAEMAQDAAQDAFMRAYQHLERLEKPSSFASWLCAITRNVCRDMKRKQKNTPLSLDKLADNGIEFGANDVASPYDKQTFAGLRKAIKTLPSKYRHVIELRYTREFSSKKIATFLELTERTVINRLYRARKELLKNLKKEGLA